MVRAIVILSSFIFVLILWIFIFLPIYYLFRLFGFNHFEKALIGFVATQWSRLLLYIAGVKAVVTGLEHIPDTDALCIVSNHQSLFDIPFIARYIPRIIGFIAKKELFYFPFFNSWMCALKCIPIDRKNPRDSVRTIEKGAQQIRDGHTMAIFPEGTRSRDGVLKPFKNGSLKLAIKSDAIILPVTIDGLWMAVSNKKFRVVPSKVRFVIHPPIAVATLTTEDKKGLADRLWHVINSGFEEKSSLPYSF
jgi:1-acyl-sn-glycerol-3-phosphate acyltransferase